MMTIKFEGGDKLAKALRNVAKKYPAERDRFLRMEGENLLSKVKPLTPADTGRLRGAWSRTEPEGGTIEVGNPVEYAQYVEFPCRQFVYGRDTGRIRPGAWMLRDSIDDLAANFQADATAILARLFG